jgi:hypothetical protein
MNQPKQTIDDLVNHYKLPKSWFYSKTREKGPDSIPVIRCGKYLRFELEEVEKWMRDQNDKNS